jgi:hypothetical protein
VYESGGHHAPPEIPDGQPRDPRRGSGHRRPGVPAGTAAGILAGVALLGVAAVLVFGHPASHGATLAAQPGRTGGAWASGSPGKAGGGGRGDPVASGAAGPSAAGGVPGQAGDQPGAVGTGTGTGVAGGPGAGSASTLAYSVGECVDTSGSGQGFTVQETGCAQAEFKIIYDFRNQSGHVGDDESRCYAINGDDAEFENGNPTDGYTLYCMNSLTGDYSPRRAGVDNCLDSSGAYEVDCTGSRAAWIVIGRLDRTTNTKGCSRFGSYDYSYFYTAPPTFVLCVNRYHH